MTVLSQKKQVKSALERIDALEQELPRLAMAVNEVLTKNAQRLGNLAAVLEAAVHILGQDVVDAKMAELEKERKAQRLAEARVKLDEAVAAGQLVPADSVDTDSFLVGTVSKAEGDSEQVQVSYDQLSNTIKDSLLGSPVGTVAQADDGSKFEVTEIYKVILPEATPEGDVSGD